MSGLEVLYIFNNLKCSNLFFFDRGLLFWWETQQHCICYWSFSLILCIWSFSFNLAVKRNTLKKKKKQECCQVWGAGLTIKDSKGLSFSRWHKSLQQLRKIKESRYTVQLPFCFSFKLSTIFLCIMANI